MSEEFDVDPKAIIARLNSMVGQPYEKPDGCTRFLKRALIEFGVELTGDNKKDARLFRKVEKPSLGTVIIFKNLQMLGDDAQFHVGLMLDGRWCIQSSRGTNGVARIEITRTQFRCAVKGFYRPRKLK